jgi:hypothetical protein
LQFRSSVELDFSAREGVDAAPAPGDLQHSERADAARELRVDDQVIADRLEAEHRPQEQQRRARRPGLRAARGRVLHRVLRGLPLIAAERLRQTTVEERGGVERVKPFLSTRAGAVAEITVERLNVPRS